MLHHKADSLVNVGYLEAEPSIQQAVWFDYEARIIPAVGCAVRQCLLVISPSALVTD